MGVVREAGNRPSFLKKFQKSIDKPQIVCYNKDTK